MAHYNIVIGYFDGSGVSTISRGRFYIPDGIPEPLRGKDISSRELQSFCMNIPTVFTEEIGYSRVPFAHIGWMTNIAPQGDIRINYKLAPGITPIPSDRLAMALGLTNFPPRGIGTMQHSHWTIKEGDLFDTLFRAGALETVQPTVFQVPKDYLQENLVSVMMPFNSQFDGVYQALQSACVSLRLECKRADDIWDHSTVIQDIFTLIFRSKIVVCDFSGKNPNVFYEAGLAHALGRNVIPIVQHPSDIPFDLTHHRYIQYLNNGQGLEKLAADIKPRLETLMSR